MKSLRCSAVGDTSFKLSSPLNSGTVVNGIKTSVAGADQVDVRKPPSKQ